MSKEIRVLVVDDSAFMRLLISDLLSSDADLEVIGTAVNGQEAVEKNKELKPDVILLDMNMDQFDGLYAVEHIMNTRPAPILILSALGNTNLDTIFDALQLGAVDYINKPVKGGSKIREIDLEIVSRVKRVARAKPRATKIVLDEAKDHAPKIKGNSRFDIIVIGASTGGPTAVEKVITALPANLNVPVVLGQHMPTNFIHSFARRLDGLSPLNIVVGMKGMVPRPGMVIIAPGDSNMILKRGGKKKEVKVDFTNEEFKEYNHPSINALMHSVAKCYEGKSIGVLLTGMGKDGVKGLRAIKDKGGVTIAQDEESSVIYGMPKMAAQSGAADVVLHIREIGGYLVNCL